MIKRKIPALSLLTLVDLDSGTETAACITAAFEQAMFCTNVAAIASKFLKECSD
jgi:hypothetical protein